VGTQALSVFGSQLTYFAMTVWLTTELYPLPEQKPALAAALSLVSLAFALPNVLIAPMAGVLTDRADRKTIMFWTDIASGLVSLALLASLALDVLELWSLVLLMTCSGVLQSIHNSSLDASYAMIVPENRLPRANGMMQTVFGLSGILAPALAASLIALPALFRGKGASGWPASMIAGIEHGATLAIAVNVLTFFTAAADSNRFFRYRRRVGPRKGDKTNFLGDVKEGIGLQRPATRAILAARGLCLF
jgi:MFS family permease